MKKTSLTDYTANTFRMLGVALVLTASLIWFGNPGKVFLFLTPFTGNRDILAWNLVCTGLISTLSSIALSRFSNKC